MVQARLAQGDSLTANAVVVIPGKPARTHRVGIVESYVPGESITIQAKDDLTYTFLINSETKILPVERMDLLAVGARVTIISSRDVTGEDALAAGIAIHPAEGSD
jgi:hypothetical protein